MKTCLTIAGSDPSGGAGIQSDLKVFQAQGCYGCSIATLETIQNTTGVKEVYLQKPEIIDKQIKALIEDFHFDAIKLSALGSEEIIRTILDSAILENSPVIVDPVFISSNGKELFSKNAAVIYSKLLVSKADIITPNILEASALTGVEINSLREMKIAAEKILKLGAKTVIIKGGHLTGEYCINLLLNEKGFLEIKNPKLETKNTHGTGCFFSASITALIAKDTRIEEAFEKSSKLTFEAIKSAPGLGKGQGPLNFLINS